MSSKVRNIGTVITETKTAQNVLENSCQAISDMFDGLKTNSETGEKDNGFK